MARGKWDTRQEEGRQMRNRERGAYGGEEGREGEGIYSKEERGKREAERENR